MDFGKPTTFYNKVSRFVDCNRPRQWLTANPRFLRQAGREDLHEPMDEVLHTGVLSTGIGREVRLSGKQLSNVYYLTRVLSPIVRSGNRETIVIQPVPNSLSTLTARMSSPP